MSLVTQMLDTPVCLFGAGGHGQVVATQLATRYSSRLSFADEEIKVGKVIRDIEVKFQSLDDIHDHLVLVTIGDNAVRRRIQQIGYNLGLVFTQIIIDPEHFFANSLGQGSQVLAGAVVNSGALIGDGVIINTNATLEHDVQVGHFTHIAPGSVIGGNASIGDNVLIGTNATVLPGVTVSEGCTIGAGSVVTKDTNRRGIYVGIPARLYKVM